MLCGMAGSRVRRGLARVSCRMHLCGSGGAAEHLAASVCCSLGTCVIAHKERSRRTQPPSTCTWDAASMPRTSILQVVLGRLEPSQLHVIAAWVPSCSNGGLV